MARAESRWRSSSARKRPVSRGLSILEFVHLGVPVHLGVSIIHSMWHIDLNEDVDTDINIDIDTDIDM